MREVTLYTVQRFRGGFAIVWRDEAGKRHRRTLYAGDRQSALVEARNLWEAADDAPWTVGKIIESYIEHLAVEDPPSLQRRRDAWKAMKTFWENVDPALIDETMCKTYRTGRSVADATARYELLLLSTALNWAVDKKHLEHRSKIWLPKKPDYEIRYLTAQEFETFYDAVRAPHARLYVLLGLYTLARPAAILELRWAQVDFARRLIDLNPPGRRQTVKKRPTVPMNDELMAALREAYEARQCDYVIECGGKPLKSIKKAFQAASKRSGLDVVPYTLRHTGAVFAAESGVSMPELAQFMGHDDDRTTQKHYARFSPDFLRNVSEGLVQRRFRNIGGSK